MRRPLVSMVLGLALVLASCGGGAADGWVSIGTGDTYGEWELFAEANDGAWTGCLRVDGSRKECASAASDFVRFEDGFGVACGVAPEEGRLELADGREVELIEPGGFDRSFYVVADNAKIRVRD